MVYHNVEQPKAAPVQQPEKSAQSLPDTGSDETAPLLYGSLLAGLGAASVLGSKRRKDEE